MRRKTSLGPGQAFLLLKAEQIHSWNDITLLFSGQRVIKTTVLILGPPFIIFEKQTLSGHISYLPPVGSARPIPHEIYQIKTVSHWGKFLILQRMCIFRQLVIYIWKIIGISSLGLKMALEVFPFFLPPVAQLFWRLAYSIFWIHTSHT